MRRNKNKPKHILIVIIALVIGIMAIFSYTLKEDRQLNKFEDFKELKNIRKKYQKLLPQVERIKSLETENIELRRQLDTMKKELSIENTLSDYEYLNATVISRNVSHWYNIITIDKGTFNGVKTDMVVVNSNGLIGRVISTTTFTSDIRLLTTSDTNNKISVTISNGENSVNGLIKDYNNNTGYLEVEGVSNTEKVAQGYYVYTSGLGGIFPSGILIGTVENITTDEYDLAKLIDVIPAADFDDINYVAILKRKEIQK